MSEDAPVNTGAVAWPDDFTASVMVRRMQTKLHLWAARDPGRRFGDLFNLVYDPAFLVVAWERVSTNKGAGTPGIDKVTAAGVEARDGVLGLLGRIREELKSGSFRPVEVQGAGVLECWDNIGLYRASMSRIVSGEIWGPRWPAGKCARYPFATVRLMRRVRLETKTGPA